MSHKITRMDLKGIAHRVKGIQPDWNYDQLFQALRQASSLAVSVEQLTAVALVAARSPHSHVRSVIDSWDDYLPAADVLAAVAAVTSKPKDQKRIDSEGAHDALAFIRRPDGTTDPAKQRAMIDDLLNGHSPGPAAGHDGYPVAVSIGLDARIDHERWTQLSTMERAMMMNAWCREQPLSLAVNESGLDLMLDVKTEAAKATQRKIDRGQRPARQQRRR